MEAAVIPIAAAVVFAEIYTPAIIRGKNPPWRSSSSESETGFIILFLNLLKKLENLSRSINQRAEQRLDVNNRSPGASSDFVQVNVR